jgi:hypothetical protein
MRAILEKISSGIFLLVFLNALCYGTLAVGFWQIYHPLGLIVPAFLLWLDLVLEARYARSIQ